VVSALLAGMFLPALFPARGAHVPEHVWAVGFLVLVVCVAASVMAAFQKKTGDRIAGIAAGLLTAWMMHWFLAEAVR
jgi:hypothetical protein